jgi:branched-subunit amino acid transport protein
MTAWMVIVAAGLASYVLRMSMISAPDQVRLPARLEDSAGLVAPAAFAALLVTSLIGTVVSATGSQAVPPVVAVAVAVVAVSLTGRPYAALLAGLPTFWIITALVAA